MHTGQTRLRDRIDTQMERLEVMFDENTTKIDDLNDAFDDIDELRRLALNGSTLDGLEQYMLEAVE